MQLVSVECRAYVTHRGDGDQREGSASSNTSGLCNVVSAGPYANYLPSLPLDSSSVR